MDCAKSESGEIVNTTTNISTFGLEKPSLYFLSTLLDPQGRAANLPVLSDFGPLSFLGMELEQERGHIPQLVLDFEFEGGCFQSVYFGYVSPFKLGTTYLQFDGEKEIERIFSEAGKEYLPMQAAERLSKIPSDFDWKIVAGSLSLWRACCGLPKACDPSLGKYFNKMKSVSRYQWKCEKYEIQGNDIIEEWSSQISYAKLGNKKVLFSIKNGLFIDLIQK